MGLTSLDLQVAFVLTQIERKRKIKNAGQKVSVYFFCGMGRSRIGGAESDCVGAEPEVAG